MNSPAEIIARLEQAGQSLGVAESLTGGLLTDAFVAVPGASAVLRGGVVAYASDVKASVLGVDPELLGRRGAVDPEVARQMAAGARHVLGATYGLATTGVAGPDPQDGQAVGTVYVAVAGPGGVAIRDLHLGGHRGQVRAGAVSAALDLLAEFLTGP